MGRWGDGVMGRWGDTVVRRIFKCSFLIAPLVLIVVGSTLQSALPADIFTPYLDQIRSNLPPGWKMRLPSQVLVSNQQDGRGSKYIVRTSLANSELGLTVSLFQCEDKPQSCLVGSFAVDAATSVEAQTELKQHQSAATPITLVNNTTGNSVKGYLLEGSKQNPTSAFTSVMWQQDGQIYTVRFPTQERQNILYMAYSMAHAVPIQSAGGMGSGEWGVGSGEKKQMGNSGSPLGIRGEWGDGGMESSSVGAGLTDGNPIGQITRQTTQQTPPSLEEPGKTNLVEQEKRSPSVTAPAIVISGNSSPTPRLPNSPFASSPHSPLPTPHSPSPLLRQPILATANQLRQGEIITSLRYRQSFPSTTSGGSVGLTGQPTFSISAGVTDGLELTLDTQTVDNSGPIRQGSFGAQRINPDGTGPNFFQEETLQAKQRLWQNQSGTEALSGVVAGSLGNAGRPFRFFNASGPVASGQNHGVVPSLELPFTVTPSDRLSFTLSPKVAFLPESNALYFNRPPVANPGAFGTTFGLAGGVSYSLNPRLLLWGDAFVPFTGNNTINRDTGLPARTIAFNAGLRYLLNPRLATDIFVSNTLGNTGALSIVADRDYPSLGLSVTYLPGVTSANRRYPSHNGATQQPPPSTPAGFGLLDGGTIRNGELLLTLQGGGQGILPGVQYGLLDDLEIGAFLNDVPGTTDESELGFSGKLRFLHQADGDPVTLSGLVTFARSNNVLINLVSNNRNEFNQLGLKKGGFAFSNERTGELFIITLSAPIDYQFKGGSEIWLTPTLGFVQRNGLQEAGFNLGGSIPLVRSLNVIGEAGLELSGKGNAFIGNNRETVIPWTAGLRWYPASLFGISTKNSLSELQLQLYVTNRVGSTPFESLRVRSGNTTAVGAGIVFPVQF